MQATIRKITKSDIDFIYNLYMHPQVNPFLLYEQMDSMIFEPIFSDLLQKEILFIYEENQIPVGMFKLIPETYRSEHIVYLGSFAIQPVFFGKGKGATMLQAIINYCKQLGFLRIELSVAAHNEKAINLYKKAGFLQEGVLKNYTNLKSEKRFIDEYMMAYLFPFPY
jgi:RimJ/RimL family protein N-acetyltransferase